MAIFKLPTTTEIINNTKKTLKRFPLAIGLMTALTFYSIFLIHKESIDNTDKFYFVIHVLMIGSIWAIALSIFNEIKQKTTGFKWISNIILVLVVVGYFFLFNDFGSDKLLYRIFIITIISIFFVLFLPYLSKNKQLDYWNYNKEIFLRLALTTIYSIVLYVGLVIALSVVNLLFQLDINEKIYFDIWVVVVGIFAFWMFLNGFPKDFYLKTKNNYHYPKGLKIFVQFIQLPLTTLYLVILYVYAAKILFIWQLPEGSVSYMVLVFSAIGLFALMLIFPIQNDDNNKWIKTFAKGFYWALFPLIILLFVAILIRVAEYGITENRFYVMIMAIWLAAVAIYMLVTKQKNIKIITISFSVLFFVSSFGPLSAFNLAKISQLNRLENILIENNIFVNGKINKDAPPVADSIYEQISDISEYVITNHGEKIVQERFNVDFETDEEYSTRYYLNNAFLDSLNIKVDYDVATDDGYFFYTYDAPFIDISQYDYYYFYKQYGNNINKEVALNDSLNFIIQVKNDDFIVKINDVSDSFSMVDFRKELFEKYSNSYGETLTDEDATFIFELNKYNAKVIINQFEGDFYNDTLNNNLLKATILIGDLRNRN